MKKSFLLFCSFVFLSFFSTVFAAAPDGNGPWADSVVSSSQGLTKNGQPVAVARSNPDAAVGVAENDYVDAHFFSLGFGGTITLRFENGVRDGVLVIETTNVDPVYPVEQARVEVSQDGFSWTEAGIVSQDQEIALPENVACIQYVRVTDVSSVQSFSDETADAYDIDGVQALNTEACTVPPSEDATPAPTPTQGTTPNNPPGNNQPSNQPASCNATKPGTPTLVSVTRTSGTTAQINWTAVNPVTHYSIVYGTSAGNYHYGVANTGNTTSFSVGGLDPNATYYFAVRAVNDCTPGDLSGEKSTTGGNVLGSSTGDVLGTSTDVLAATGSFSEHVRLAVAFAATAGVMYLFHFFRRETA